MGKPFIHKFNQFNDFELDLTYPKGHEKEGLPLDKVCFIGQSGTGKTTMLEMINSCIKTSDSSSDFEYYSRSSRRPESWVEIFATEDENEGISFIGIDVFDKNVIDQFGLSFEKESDEPLNYFKRLIHLSAGLFNVTFSEKISDQVEEPEVNYYLNDSKFFSFNKKSIEKLWNNSFSKVQEYQNQEASFRLNLTHELEFGASIDVKTAMNEWRRQNQNPLEKIANECLDPILNNFFLSVKTRIDDYENRKFIQIQSTQNGGIIPYENLSSGTRQIIFTAFPIYSLLEENSVILIDEPENSLYPDIQKEIIEYYTSFDKEKKSQFFFATHSPIIASSFEPWEIVELKFDAEGNIYRELYFEGENHVDNYHTDARYLRWDGILTKVFDLKDEGNTEFRAKKLMDFSILKKKIEKLKSNPNFDSNSKEFKILRKEFERAGELLDWET